MAWFRKLIALFFHEDPEQIAIAGTTLSEADVARLENRLRKHPTDVRARYKVLGYMGQHRFMNPELAQRRVDHVLWFIENRPELAFTGSPFCHVMGLEPEYHRVRAAWDNVVAAHDLPTAALRSAARFFSLEDPKRSQDLLERGERLEPDSPDWAEELGNDLWREVAVAERIADRGGEPKGPPKDLKAISLQALGHFERALGLAKVVERRFHLLSDCAKAALEGGRRDEAIRFAEEALAVAPRCDGDRHQPDIIHRAHIVRGRARVEAGDLDGACRDLEDAGRQGSLKAPVLRSFGPDFQLARMLLDAGRRDAVLSYLARCGTFWNPKRVARWQAAIEKGELPRMSTDFDPTEPRDEQGPYWVSR